MSDALVRAPDLVLLVVSVGGLALAIYLYWASRRVRALRAVREQSEVAEALKASLGAASGKRRKTRPRPRADSDAT
jgi:threonine dehydratase